VNWRMEGRGANYDVTVCRVLIKYEAVFNAIRFPAIVINRRKPWMGLTTVIVEMLLKLFSQGLVISYQSSTCHAWA